MADYSYRPRRIPPRRIDRFLARPHEHVWAGFSALLGCLLCINVFLPDAMIGIYRLPDVLYLIIGVLVAVGGAASIAGLQISRDRLSLGWALERAGQTVQGAGWVGAVIVLLNIEPLMVFGVIVSASLVLTSALRVLLLQTVEKQAREDTGKEAT